MARLEKLRGGLSLIDKQLDALRSSELDKELMNSLRVSSQAMKKAGIGVGVEEAESVMNELDDQIREASELTTVLATPIVDHLGMTDADLADVDAELGIIAEEDDMLMELPASAASTSVVAPVPISTQRPVAPPVLQRQADRQQPAAAAPREAAADF